MRKCTIQSTYKGTYWHPRDGRSTNQLKDGLLNVVMCLQKFDFTLHYAIRGGQPTTLTFDLLDVMENLHNFATGLYRRIQEKNKNF